MPDEVVLAMVKDAVSTEECKTKGWLLDGFPRTAFQVSPLSSLPLISGFPNCNRNALIH